ncbi:MAG TPA: hypothetical protein VGC42_17025, partial [Kofleriaceae bacterium]
GAGVYTAFALGGDATGLDARFLFVDAVRDPALSTGWRYGLQARALGATRSATVALGAENFAIDRAHHVGVVSFAAGAAGATEQDDVAGLWAIDLSSL